jgi:hypothetical protein
MSIDNDHLLIPRGDIPKEKATGVNPPPANCGRALATTSPPKISRNVTSALFFCLHLRVPLCFSARDSACTSLFSVIPFLGDFDESKQYLLVN